MQPAPARSHGLIGNSEQIAAVRQLIDRAARHRLPVLLLGESGAGKEVVARAIHHSNARGQFVPIDCGSLVGTLMESELFGHVKGAFSGAFDNKKGLVELADGGTAFLDEIGDLPLDMQVKLLRLIQEREFRAVGSLLWRKVDIRIIAATHRNIKEEAAAGRFRLDLYYRLNVCVIRLPPLRHRPGDIPPLIDYFTQAAAHAGLPHIRLSDKMIDLLQSYEWPGNVRELKHCIDRMAAMYSDGAAELALPTGLLNRVASDDIAAQLNPGGLADSRMVLRPDPTPVVVSIAQSERKTIERALTATNGERTRAAHMLGIGRTTLYRKMKQYGLA
jgi:DNA-binding NtrC family response regulator